MNSKEFLESIAPKIEPYFRRLEFQYKKSKGGFIKTFEEGWTLVSLPFYRHGNTDNFNVTFCVRHNLATEIFLKYIEINPSDHKTTTTFGVNLTSIINYGDHSFSYIGQDQLMIYIEERVVPFLVNDLPFMAQRYSKLINMYSLFTDVTEKYNRLIRDTYSNYIMALVVGWLIEPANLDKLVQFANSRYEKLKKKWPGHLDVELFERDFNNIVEDLRRANGDPQKTGNYWSVAKLK